MANNLSSNITRKVARVFLDAFESSRVVSKAVNTQLLSGKFNPSTGSIVDFKRPHDYNTLRTAGGDISSPGVKSDIISGKASGVVQNYFTVATEWGNVEEALELDQLDQILAPMARRIVTDMEVDLYRYMYTNCNLSYGTPGTPVTTWSHVAAAGALMDAVGIPKDQDWNYIMNPYTRVALASAQSGLDAASDLVKTSWEKATVTPNLAGMRVMSSNAVVGYTSGTASDRAGILAANPTVTYVAAKDTMTQTLSCSGFSGGATFKAGEIIQITGRYRLNLSTRQQMTDATGAQVLWRAVITEDATSNTAGAVTLTVAGPAIYEANGQYNTTPAAIVQNDVITVLGAASTLYVPNMFLHKQAFGLGTVKLPKLYSTDTVATTEDGMSIRVSKYADGDANTQKIRFDLLPAYATFQPFFAGQAFGSS